MNAMNTPVPGSKTAVSAHFFTQEDISDMVKMSVRWVRENLLSTGIIPCISVGRSYRVDPDEFRRWRELGCPGLPRKDARAV
jgi:hypothetical protein